MSRATCSWRRRSAECTTTVGTKFSPSGKWTKTWDGPDFLSLCGTRNPLKPDTEFDIRYAILIKISYRLWMVKYELTTIIILKRFILIKNVHAIFLKQLYLKKKNLLFSILMLPNRVYLAGCIRVMHKFCMRQLKTAFLKCVKSSCIRKCVGFKNAKFQRLYFNSTVTITLWKQFFSLLWIQEVEHNFSRDIVHFKSPNSRTIFLKI